MMPRNHKYQLTKNISQVMVSPTVSLHDGLYELAITHPCETSLKSPFAIVVIISPFSHPSRVSRSQLYHAPIDFFFGHALLIAIDLAFRRSTSSYFRSHFATL